MFLIAPMVDGISPFNRFCDNWTYPTHPNSMKEIDDEVG